MAAPGAPNPEDLLMQIKDLLDQYLALGSDTPVAPEAQALADAIDSSAGAGGAPTDVQDPGDALAQALGGGGASPDYGVPDMTDSEPQNFSSFKDASSALQEDMRKKKRSKG